MYEWNVRYDTSKVLLVRHGEGTFHLMTDLTTTIIITTYYDYTLCFVLLSIHQLILEHKQGRTPPHKQFKRLYRLKLYQESDSYKT